MLAYLARILPPIGTLVPQVAAKYGGNGHRQPITAVLLAFRAIDTLLEVIALIFALIGVWSLAAGLGSAITQVESAPRQILLHHTAGRACYCFRRPTFRPQSPPMNIPVCMQSMNCDLQCRTQLLICLPLQLRMQSDLA